MFVKGKNAAREILNSDYKIDKIYLQDNFKNDELLKLINKRNLNITYKSQSEMDKMSKDIHQGIILEVEDYKYSSLEELLSIENGFLVMLDHIEDPHNFGAIIRSCEAAGVDGIIIPEDRNVQVTGTVLKTSVGTAEKMKIARVVNLNNTIKKLKDNGYWIYGTDMEGVDYTTLDYKGKICIICGNEGKGISKLVKDNCDFIATIPMKGNVNSLNASVATAIIIFEAMKQR